MRLRVLEDAGRLSVPFTTGLLVGIGETLDRAGRVDLRAAPRRPRVRPRPGGHRPELPRQARHRDAARRRPRPRGVPSPRSPSPGSCSARRCGCRRRPTWSTSTECRALLGAGVDDWGGVSPLTPDHVNPERPWPSLDRLRSVTAAAGFELRARLTVHPEYVLAGEPWIDPRVSAHVAALADDDGPGREPGVRARRAALAGARRRLRQRRHRPHRPARRRRHRGPHRRPPLRLRQRLRRLGRRCKAEIVRHDRDPSSTASRCRNVPDYPAALRCRPPRRTRATCPTSTR